MNGTAKKMRETFDRQIGRAVRVIFQTKGIVCNLKKIIYFLKFA